jgi:hypothetical protein
MSEPQKSIGSYNYNVSHLDKFEVFSLTAQISRAGLTSQSDQWETLQHLEEREAEEPTVTAAVLARGRGIHRQQATNE